MGLRQFMGFPLVVNIINDKVVLFRESLINMTGLLFTHDFKWNCLLRPWLKDQWWAFGPPLMNDSVGQNDLGGHGKTFLILWFYEVVYFSHQEGKSGFWPFLDPFQPFWSTAWLKRKKSIKQKVVSCWYLMVCWPLFLLFSVRKCFNILKNNKKGPKVACTVLRTFFC